MVDRKEIAFNPAVELSFLKKEEQQGFLEAMDYSPLHRCLRHSGLKSSVRQVYVPRKL